MLAVDVIDPAAERDLAAIHRLAEKVGGLDLAGDALAGPVKVLAGGGADLELGQDVGFDGHRLFRAGVAHGGRDLVVAVIYLAGQLKLPRRDAVLGRRAGLAKDLVAFGIGDGQFDLLACGRHAVERTQSQRADQDLLARLVDRFVGGHQDLEAALDGHRLLQGVPAQLRAGLYNDLLGRVRDLGDVERGGHASLTIGCALVKQLGPSTGLGLERDTDLGCGDRLAIAVSLDLYVEQARCAGDELALAEDQRILLAEGIR